jgi:hypothetical protein
MSTSVLCTIRLSCAQSAISDQRLDPLEGSGRLFSSWCSTTASEAFFT